MTSESVDPRDDVLFARCSNHGRWGPDDERGTLNLIDDDSRRRAAGLVRAGVAVPIGRPLPVAGSTVSDHPVVVTLLAPRDEHSAVDAVYVTAHDPQITHIDALGHMFVGEHAYNGRHRAEVLGGARLQALSVAAFRQGVFCRGVLLDVAAERGVPYLAKDEFVTVSDLEAAERSAGVRVEPGDALVVHVGRAQRLAATGEPDLPGARAGLHSSVLPWLRDRDVAVFLGDCTERTPPEDGAEPPLPLHQLGIVAMGLCLIDGVLTTPLLEACRRLGRYEFLLCCTVPEIPGATAAPVNPLCLF